MKKIGCVLIGSILLFQCSLSKEEKYKTAPDNVTVSTILEKYYDALGGKQKILDIKSVEISFSAINKAKKEITGTSYFQEGQFYSVIVIDGKENRSWYDKGKNKGLIETPKGTILPEGSELERLKEEANFLQGLFLNNNYSLELLGVTEVNSKDAFAIQAKGGSEKPRFYYYDTNTGLLVRVQEENGMNIYLSDYGVVEGINFPQKIERVDAGSRSIKFTATSINVNQTIDRGYFNF